MTRRRECGALRRALVGWTVLLATAVAVDALAQDDKQTEDLKERDRRYYERQTRGEADASDKAKADDPGDDRDAQVQAFLVEADRLIRDRNHESKTTDHYRVQTDDPRLDPVAAAELLESFRTYFAEFWSERTELRPYEGGSRIFLFYSYFKYNQLLTGKKRFDTFQSAGHYRPYFDVVVIHSDSVAPGDLPATLVHEAAHQLMANQVAGEYGLEAPWISEGIAAYFGYTQRGADGRFLPGAIGGKGTSLFRDMKASTEGSGARRLKETKRALKKSDPPALEPFMAMGPSTFYGEEIEGNYSVAWLLVHYLFHGEDGRLAGPFVEFLRKVAAGPEGPEALFAELGRTPEEVAAGFQEYVVNLKTRPAKR